MGLTLTEANRIVGGAITEVRKRNAEISVTVCNAAGRPIDRQRTASTSNAHPPGRARMLYQLTLPGRLHS